jgi:hypothetical protein
MFVMKEFHKTFRLLPAFSTNRAEWRRTLAALVTHGVPFDKMTDFLGKVFRVVSGPF